MVQESVEQEISELVNVLINTVPDLRSIRVYGSYERDTWNPEKSDIDVLVVTKDNTYYSGRDNRVSYDGFTDIVRESSQRAELRSRIKNQLTGTYKDRFSLALCSPRDIVELMFRNEGRGYIGLNMVRGRRLYGRKNIFDYTKEVREFLRSNG